jgi:excisionase family DNA binding protein
MNTNGTSRRGQRAHYVRTPGEWLSSGEAARMIGVDPRTLRGYEDNGLIKSHQTPGGHRRYRKSDVDTLLKTIRGDQ